MPKLPIKTLLFDFDGTLVDTEPTAVFAVRHWFKKWKIDLAPSDATYVTGRTWESAFAFLFSKYSIPIEKTSAKTLILDLYHEEVKKNLIVVPGCVAAVRALAQTYPLGLVSGSPRADIIWALTQLQILEHFQIILGAENYPKSKPAPDGYLKAAEYFKTKPSECLVFEDSLAGIASGKNAGMWVVAITSTNHFSQDISQSDFQTPSLEGVNSEWVQNLSID